MSWWDEFKEGFRDRISEGREDYGQAHYRGRDKENKDVEGTRISTTLGTNPTITTARDILADAKLPGGSRTEHRQARQEAGMGLAPNGARRYGQIAGTIGNDLVQDHTRSIWWLINAPQATANVLSELTLAKANPDLFRHKTKTYDEFSGSESTAEGVKEVRRGIPKVQFEGTDLQTHGLTKDQQKRNARAYELAQKEGYIDKYGNMRKGVRLDKTGSYSRRRYDPGDVALLLAPTGVAINAGIGLLNPLGGSGGYTAALPSEDDMTKTSNVIGEVGAKYILGRTGNLLPYEEFSKYRPDVDIGEYNRYKAFKYDKEMDFNIFDDGQVNLAPMGIAKFTMDGIHGPEAQFLGRSLPVTTTLVPYLGALAGAAAGVRTKRPIKHGLLGGTAGLVAGGATGLVAEELRRRASSNQVQMEGGNAEQYLG